MKTTLVRDGSESGRIQGVVLRELRINRDSRGTLTELVRTDWTDLYDGDLPFAQDYTSTTMPGVARDEDRWHYHRYQTDRFYCSVVRIVVAIADSRVDSPTKNQLMLIELAAGEDAPAPLVVTIPAETLHGFEVTSAMPATLLNFPTRLYDASDEGRIPFAEAGVDFADGTSFTYDAVRAHYRERGIAS